MFDDLVSAFVKAEELTLDKLLQIKAALKTIYYLASGYVPKESPPAPGEPDEPGVFRIDIEGYQVWVFHTDYLPGFLEAAKENGWRAVDFRTAEYWKSKPFTPAVLEMELCIDLRRLRRTQAPD